MDATNELYGKYKNLENIINNIEDEQLQELMRQHKQVFNRRTRNCGDKIELDSEFFYSLFDAISHRCLLEGVACLGDYEDIRERSIGYNMLLFSEWVDGNIKTNFNYDTILEKYEIEKAENKLLKKRLEKRNI